MSTPVKRPDATAAVPATPAPPLDPVPVAAPIGWLLIVAAATGLIIATWALYPVTSDGMWAGYRGGVTATVVILCAMALNTSLPTKPFLGIIGLSGAFLVMSALFISDPTVVIVSEILSGAVILVGTLLYAAGHRR